MHITFCLPKELRYRTFVAPYFDKISVSRTYQEPEEIYAANHRNRLPRLSLSQAWAAEISCIFDRGEV
jgi:hypothetical protein